MLGSGRRGQQGERQALFEEVAIVHMDGLYNLALKLTRSAPEAEDLIQETYLRAYRSFDRFEQGTNCKAWLFRILRNCFINRYRSRRTRLETVGFSAIEGKMEAMVSDSWQSSPADPEEALTSARIDEAVQEALGEIPPEYRSALVLCLVEGFSYREVASILSCPIGTVMSRIHRARKLLQDRLADLARSEGVLGPESNSENPIPAGQSGGSFPGTLPVDMRRYRRRRSREKRKDH